MTNLGFPLQSKTYLSCHVSIMIEDKPDIFTFLLQFGSKINLLTQMRLSTYRRERTFILFYSILVFSQIFLQQTSQFILQIFQRLLKMTKNALFFLINFFIIEQNIIFSAGFELIFHFIVHILLLAILTIMFVDIIIRELYSF